MLVETPMNQTTRSRAVPSLTFIDPANFRSALVPITVYVAIFMVRLRRTNNGSKCYHQRSSGRTI